MVDFYDEDEPLVLEGRGFGSTFEGVGFDACTLNGVDLTGATSLIVGDPRTLKGAALCETQVPAVAHRLAELTGIEIRDC